MAHSLFPTIHNEKKKYILNSHRIKKLGDRILLITEQGAWVALSRNEYAMLIRGDAEGPYLGGLEAKGIILTEDNVDSVIKLQDSRIQFITYPTALHIIVPTLRCNHQCIYCHSAVYDPSCKEKDMTTETAQKILDFIFGSPGKSIKIEFQGGDTLLNFEVFQFIVKRAKEMNLEYCKDIHFALVTNLTLMDLEKLSWIVKEKVNITTSLDGPQAIHDANRTYFGGKGTHADVIGMIKKCKARNVNVGALMVTTKYSFSDPEGIIDEYLKIGQNNIQLKFLNRLGFADNQWKEIGYTAEEYLEYWKRSMDYIIEVNKKGTYFSERMTQLILKKILTPSDPGFLDFRSPCGTVAGQLAYNYNGDVYPCDEGRAHEEFNMGNVNSLNHKQLVGSPKAQSMIKASVTDTLACDTCVYKPYCGVCPVLNFAEEGNIIPKLAKNTRCKIFKGMFDYVFDKLLNDTDAKKVLVRWVRRCK